MGKEDGMPISAFYSGSREEPRGLYTTLFSTYKNGLAVPQNNIIFFNTYLVSLNLHLSLPFSPSPSYQYVNPNLSCWGKTNFATYGKLFSHRTDIGPRKYAMKDRK